jgi:16S rRNA (adenine1518-N6/adenine1519-N6)-dimethyltransferase
MLKKSLSQHLIKDRNITDKMVRLAGITEQDTVVEIGAGYGDLTRSITARAGHVYAVEFDRELMPRLEQLAGEYPNLTIIHDDFLKVPLSQFKNKNYIKVMGNIPYKITGPIIFKLLQERRVLSHACLTMQAEVARRIVSTPCKRSYGSISAVCQILCNVQILFNLKPSVFVPPPKVDSAFLSMVPKDEKRHITNDVFPFIRVCFQNKRKYFRYALSKIYSEEVIDRIYSYMQFSETIRAEGITPDQFEKMYSFLRDEETTLDQAR